MVDRQGLDRFFEGLRARVNLAREVDARLDQQLARRFNVLDYIRTSEMGLSRVIGDLFDPKASHGQEILFLDTFLLGLKRSSEDARRPLDLTLGYGDEWTVRGDTVRVRLERMIAGGRRLDVSVEFEGSDGKTRCLAIENKPYAGDQKDQIHDYLDFMEKEYGGRSDGNPTRHLLIYLSRTGEGPSEWSVRGSRLAKEIGERDFVVMGYYSYSLSNESAGTSNSDDDSDPSRLFLDYTLAEWFGACRRTCDIDRLRSFLRDAESFCERRFGGVTVTDATTQQVVSFLSQPDNFGVATAVHREWPTVRDGIVNAFAERLRDRVCDEVRAIHGNDIECRWTPDKRQRIHKTHLDVIHPSWEAVNVRIRLEAMSHGPNGWIIGTLTTGGQTEPDDALRSALREGLGSQLEGGQYVNRWWPWQKAVTEQWRHWWDILRTLAKPESEDAKAATRYFVDLFVEICEKAIPIIDDAVRRTRATTGS